MDDTHRLSCLTFCSPFARMFLTNMSRKTLHWIGAISIVVAVLSAGNTSFGRLYFVVFNHDTYFFQKVQYVAVFFFFCCLGIH